MPSLTMPRAGSKQPLGTGGGPQSELAERLRAERVVDTAGQLSSADLQRVRAGIARAEQAGRWAYVLVLDGASDPAAWRGLWDAMGLHTDGDLLLLYNGHRWEARGWNRTAAEVSALLEAQEAALQADRAGGLTAALEALGSGRAAPSAVAPSAATAPPGEVGQGSGLGFWLGTGGLALVAATAFIIRRRIKREQEVRRELDTAFDSAEATYTRVTLTADDLDEATATRIQLEAAALHDQLRDLREASAAAGGSPATLGRVAHIEDELRALYSDVLQAGQTAAAAAVDEPLDKPTRR